MRKKEGISLIITILILCVIFYFGSVDAVELFIELPSDTVDSQSSISFIVNVDIASNERIPIENLTLSIGNKICHFTPDGVELLGDLCSQITITRLNSPDATYGPGFGYGYGSNSTAIHLPFNTTYFGYGYGYGYGDDADSDYSDLSYNVTWQTPKVSSDTKYEISFKLTNSLRTYELESPPTLTVNAEESSSSSGSSGGIALSPSPPGQFTHRVVELEPEPMKHAITVVAPDLAVDKITFSLDTKVYDREVTVKRVSSLPADRPAIHGLVYQLLRIDVDIENEDITSADINFRVNASWLEDNNCTPESISLFRLHDDRWVELETRFIRQEGSEMLFVSRTPGFSYFAIAKKTADVVQGPVVVPEPEPVEEPSEPSATPLTEEPPEPETSDSGYLSTALLVILLAVVAIGILTIAHYRSKQD